MIRCRECAFWDPKLTKQKYGHCRRNPPFYVGLEFDAPEGYKPTPDEHVQWPITSEGDWCGEYKVAVGINPWPKAVCAKPGNVAIDGVLEELLCTLPHGHSGDHQNVRPNPDAPRRKVTTTWPKRNANVGSHSSAPETPDVDHA